MHHAFMPDPKKTTSKMKMTSNMKITSKMRTISKMKMTGTANLTQEWICYQLSKPEIEFDAMKEMYAALGMQTWS